MTFSSHASPLTPSPSSSKDGEAVSRYIPQPIGTPCRKSRAASTSILLNNVGRIDDTDPFSMTTPQNVVPPNRVDKLRLWDSGTVLTPPSSSRSGLGWQDKIDHRMDNLKEELKHLEEQIRSLKDNKKSNDESGDASKTKVCECAPCEMLRIQLRLLKEKHNRAAQSSRIARPGDFVMVLLNGNSSLFNTDLYLKGAAGGEQAIRALRDAVAKSKGIRELLGLDQISEVKSKDQEKRKSAEFRKSDGEATPESERSVTESDHTTVPTSCAHPLQENITLAPSRSVSSSSENVSDNQRNLASATCGDGGVQIKSGHTSANSSKPGGTSTNIVKGVWRDATNDRSRKGGTSKSEILKIAAQKGELGDTGLLSSTSTTPYDALDEMPESAPTLAVQVESSDDMAKEEMDDNKETSTGGTSKQPFPLRIRVNIYYNFEELLQQLSDRPSAIRSSVNGIQQQRLGDKHLATQSQVDTLSGLLKDFIGQVNTQFDVCMLATSPNAHRQELINKMNESVSLMAEVEECRIIVVMADITEEALRLLEESTKVDAAGKLAAVKEWQDAAEAERENPRLVLTNGVFEVDRIRGRIYKVREDGTVDRGPDAEEYVPHPYVPLPPKRNELEENLEHSRKYVQEQQQKAQPIIQPGMYFPNTATSPAQPYAGMYNGQQQRFGTITNYYQQPAFLLHPGCAVDNNFGYWQNGAQPYPTGPYNGLGIYSIPAVPNAYVQHPYGMQGCHNPLFQVPAAASSVLSQGQQMPIHEYVCWQAAQNGLSHVDNNVDMQATFMPQFDYNAAYPVPTYSPSAQPPAYVSESVSTSLTTSVASIGSESMDKSISSSSSVPSISSDICASSLPSQHSASLSYASVVEAPSSMPRSSIERKSANTDARKKNFYTIELLPILEVYDITDKITDHRGSSKSVHRADQWKRPDLSRAFADQQPTAPCNRHYLLPEGCQDAKCQYGHNFLLKAKDIIALAYDSKKSPCSHMMRAKQCPDGPAACAMGHVCPFGQDCHYKQNAKQSGQEGARHGCKFHLAGMHDGVAILPDPKKRNSDKKYGAHVTIDSVLHAWQKQHASNTKKH